MFVLEENKVRFIASDLVDPGKIEEKHSGILDLKPDDLYGCGCNDSHVQASALYQHKYYSLHHKSKHIFESYYICPKCSEKLNFLYNTSTFIHSCGVSIDTSHKYIYMWD